MLPFRLEGAVVVAAVITGLASMLTGAAVGCSSKDRYCAVGCASQLAIGAAAAVVTYLLGVDLAAGPGSGR